MSNHKPKSCVWDYFTKVDRKNECIYCKRQLSGSATRLKEHLNDRCLMTPEAAKKAINRESKKTKYDEERPSSGMSSNSSILSFADLMSNNDKEEVDSLVAKMIFKANLPFRLVENEDFKNLLKKLKPSYPGISRKVLSDRYLDVEYSKVKLITEEAINKSLGLTLQMDGWSNINRNSIINVLVCTPQPYFIRSYNTGAESHTSAFLLKVLDEQIESLGPQKLVAVITDNAANMALMRRHMNEKYPKIQEFGCAAHSLNLLIHDISEIEEIKNFINSVELVVKEITQSNVRSAKFTDVSKGKTNRLVMRNKTRWYSTVNMLQSVQNARETLGKMAFNNDLNKSKNIILEKNGVEFWSPLKNLIKLLAPISKAIGEVESDKSLISDLPAILNDLEAEITTIAEEDFILIRNDLFTKLENRREFMETSFHFFSNIIDPRYLGKSLSNTQINKGFEFWDNFLKTLDLEEQRKAKILRAFQNFRSKIGSYKHEFLFNKSYCANPYLWWKGFLDIEEERHFALIAAKIFTVPSSTGATERSFSNEGRIHSKLRNRLSDSNVEKLLYIQFNSSKEKLNFNEYDSDISEPDEQIVD